MVPEVTTVPYGTANTQTAVESAILVLANSEVDSGYTVTIAPGSTYSTATKVWNGEFIVTNNTTPANTATDAAYRTATVATSASIAGATSELAKVTNASIATVPYGTDITTAGTAQATVEGLIKSSALADLDAGYTVTIAPGSTYSTATKLWTGKLTVTETATGATVTDSTYRAITIVTGVSTAGATSELANITAVAVPATPVVPEVTTVPYGTANTQTAVESAILVLANSEVDSGYTVTIAPGSTYSTATKVWNGEFIVTNNTTPANTATDAAYRTATVATSVSTAGATSELAKVTNASIATVPYGTNITTAGTAQATVEGLIKSSALADLDAGYTVTIAPGSTYSTATKLWTGELTVTETATGATATDSTYRTITIATGADTTGATLALANITTASVQTLPSGTANTQAGVESAILVLANSEVGTGYTVTIAPGSSYNTVTKAWSGKFIVTNNTTPSNTVTDAARTFIVAQ